MRYLNAVGGGIITRIGEKGVVTVLEEDGFETPVLANDVVVVADTNELNFVSESKSKPDTTTTLGHAGSAARARHSLQSATRSMTTGRSRPTWTIPPARPTA